MPDFGVTSLVGIIDGVKVLAFAVKEGRVAVHCHAGLGRTGEINHTACKVLANIEPAYTHAWLFKTMCVCRVKTAVFLLLNRCPDSLLLGLHFAHQPQRGCSLCAY